MPEQETAEDRPKLLDHIARKVARLLAPCDACERDTIMEQVQQLLANPPMTKPRADPRIGTLFTWGLISVRTHNAFMMEHPYQEKTGLEDIDPDELRLSHLTSVSVGDLSRLQGFGRACYYELSAVMERYGWNFGHSRLGRIAIPTPYLENPEAGRAGAERDAERRRQSDERDRAMLRLKDDRKLTYAQIGEQFGISASLAKTRIGAARSMEARRAADPLPDPPKAKAESK